MQISFSKWRHKIRWQPHRYRPSLTAYLTPPEGSTPIFFRQNYRKGCSLDYLDGFGHYFGVGWGWGGDVGVSDREEQ